MHVYIYDAFLNQGKYEKILTQIETRITDLGLNGKIARLGVMKNVSDLIDSELRRGAKTIIAVGNNSTIEQVLPNIVDSDVPLGIIPVEKQNNSIADSLGIKNYEEACNILSARRMEKLDVGYLGNHYFVSSVQINSEGTLLDIESSYSIEADTSGKIFLVNLATDEIEFPETAYIDPKDSKLHLFIFSKSRKGFLKTVPAKSIIPFQKLTVYNKQGKIFVNDSFSMEAPVESGVLPLGLKVIVGKNRSI